MPLIETSWGYGVITGVEDYYGDDDEVEASVTTLFDGWTVYCLRHEYTYSWEGVEEEPGYAEALAQSPDRFCPSCEEEWGAWLAAQPPPPASDLDSDSRRELAETRAAEEYERDGPEGVEHPEGWR